MKKRNMSKGGYKAKSAPDRKPLKPSVSKGPKKLAGKLKSAKMAHKSV